MESREKLKTLLMDSSSLDEEEKVVLVEQISKLSDAEVDEAIEVLELEAEKWEDLRKSDEEALNIFDQFVEKSNEEIDTAYKNTVEGVEKKSLKAESDEADNLLKNI